jgi:AbrB family looped-hinge helix DNA binding protein
MNSSRITQKYQATIPAAIRKLLDLHGGDLVGFEVHDKEVIIRKVKPLDLEFARALEYTVNDEWESAEDDKLYSDL